MYGMPGEEGGQGRQDGKVGGQSGKRRVRRIDGNLDVPDPAAARRAAPRLECVGKCAVCNTISYVNIFSQ